MKHCLYCGNNPTPHAIHKFYESLDILTGSIRRRVNQTRFGKFMDRLTTKVALGIFYVLHPLGLIRINPDIKLVPFERARTLWQEAINQNIQMEEIKPFNQSIDLYRARLHDKYLYFMNLPRPETVMTSNLAWIDDKYLLKQKLLQHNFPAPQGGSFTSFAEASKNFRNLDRPVIVKPRAGSRGRHTTTLVHTEEEFKQAFRVAKQLCHWVMVEEHLFGDVQRATVIGGKFIGMLGGSPPRVTGDGVSTIEELIQIKNSIRPPKVKEIKINPYFMQRQGLALSTILPAGKTVDLSEKIGVNYGGTSYDCTKKTHPDTKQMFEELGKFLNISIIGFDFIIPDVSKSYKEQKSGIIEANGAPFIQLHHDPLYGESINAAKYVWDLVT